MTANFLNIESLYTKFNMLGLERMTYKQWSLEPLIKRKVTRDLVAYDYRIYIKPKYLIYNRHTYYPSEIERFFKTMLEDVKKLNGA